MPRLCRSGEVQSSQAVRTAAASRNPFRSLGGRRAVSDDPQLGGELWRYPQARQGGFLNE